MGQKQTCSRRIKPLIRNGKTIVEARSLCVAPLRGSRHTACEANLSQNQYGGTVHAFGHSVILKVTVQQFPAIWPKSVSLANSDELGQKPLCAGTSVSCGVSVTRIDGHTVLCLRYGASQNSEPDQLSVILPLFLLKIDIPINKLSANSHHLASLLLSHYEIYRQLRSRGMESGLIHQLQHQREVGRPDTHCRRKRYQNQIHDPPSGKLN